MEEKGKKLKKLWGKKQKKGEKNWDRATDKSESHKEGEWEKAFDGRTQQQKEGGREGEAAQFMPLSPRSTDSSLGGIRL